MPFLNREAHEVLSAELVKMRYPSGLYSFSKRKDELNLLAGDRRYCWKIRGLTFYGMEDIIATLHRVNDERLRARRARTTQIDIEDLIEAKSAS